MSETDENVLSWTIRTVPSQKNPVHETVKIMNKWGSYPYPLQLIAERARKKIISKLKKVQEIHFDYNFFVLFGNLEGKSIWFTNTYILDYAPIYFGEHITIGPDVKLITSWHPFENFNEVKAAPIILENNVWLTMNIIVLPGVKIGENSVIGAGSIVTKSIPPNVFAAGNPAKVIKNIDRTYGWWKDLEKECNTPIKVKKNFFRKGIFIIKIISNSLCEFWKLLKLIK